MAFENLGIGGVLTFDNTQAVRGMGGASNSMRMLRVNADQLAAGVSRMGQGFKSLGMLSVASAAGLGFGAKQAMDFEHQMAAVGAVTRSNSEELRKNTEFARRLGIETSFSATQAGQAMEVLGKFGLVGDSLRTATKGVVSLAAAEGIDLAAAAKVSVGSLRAMNMSVDESARAANVLALASASTAANAISMGESFSYAGGTLQSLGLDYEQSAAVFGLLANRMIDGSRAGTGIMALFRGLQGSSSQAVKLMAKLGINVQQFGGDLSRLPEIIMHVKEKLDRGYKTPLEKARATTKIFGRFGQVVFSALSGAGGKALTDLTKQLRESGTAFKENGKTMGAAAWMAQQRMKTVKGSVTLFKSSLESFFITIMSSFLGPMRKQIMLVTDNFNNVLYAMQDLDKDDSLLNQEKLAKKYGGTSIQVALGVRDAIKLMKDSWRTVGDQIRKIGALFGESLGAGALRSVIKFTLGITMILGTLVPVFAALFALKFLLGIVWAIGSGAFLAIQAAALPVVIAIGAVVAALMIMGREGESLWDTTVRLFTGIYNFGREVMSTAIMPLFNGVYSVIKAFTVEIEGFWVSVANRLRGIIEGVVGVFRNSIRIAIAVLTPVLSLIGAVVMKLRPIFQVLVGFALTVAEVVVKIAQSLMGLFKTVANWIGIIIKYIKPLILDVISFVTPIATVIVNVLGGMFKILGAIITTVISAVKSVLDYLQPVLSVVGKLIRIVWELGKVWLSMVLTPLRWAYQVIKTIAVWVWEKIGPGFMVVAKALQTVIATIGAAAKAIFQALLWPFRKLAEGLAWVVFKIAKAAKYIPGLDADTLRSLGTALEAFAAPEVAAKGKATAEPGTVMAMRQYKAPTFGEGAAEREAKEKETKVTIVDKRTLNVNAQTSIDGRCVAAASSRHQVELKERAGYGTTPWQRRAVVARAGSTTPTRAQ